MIVVGNVLYGPHTKWLSEGVKSTVGGVQRLQNEKRTIRIFLSISDLAGGKTNPTGFITRGSDQGLSVVSAFRIPTEASRGMN